MKWNLYFNIMNYKNVLKNFEISDLTCSAFLRTYTESSSARRLKKSMKACVDGRGFISDKSASGSCKISTKSTCSWFALKLIGNHVKIIHFS